MRYKPLTDYSDITPFAQCPSCAQLIKLKSFNDAILKGAQDCPFCHSFIEKKDIILSCETYLKRTRAIQSAQDVFYAYWGLLIVLAEISLVSTITYFGELEKYNFFFFIVLLFSSLIVLSGFLSTQNWLSAFGKLQTADEEFIAAKSKIRNTQIIWVWIVIIYSIWIFAYIKFL